MGWDMFEDLRDYVGRKIVKILESEVGKESAIEIEKRMSYEDRRRILKEFESNGKLKDETYRYILSKYHYKDLTSVLFGIPSEIVVRPEITNSLIGSGKFGIEGLRKHLRELRYSEDDFEEILQSLYSEIEKKSREEKYRGLLATACVEIGFYYLDKDYEKAEKFLLEAYELRKALQPRGLRKLAEALTELGSRYSRIRKTEKAEILFDRAYATFKELLDMALISQEEFSTASSRVSEYRKKSAEF